MLQLSGRDCLRFRPGRERDDLALTSLVGIDCSLDQGTIHATGTFTLSCTARELGNHAVQINAIGCCNDLRHVALLTVHVSNPPSAITSVATRPSLLNLGPLLFYALSLAGAVILAITGLVIILIRRDRHRSSAPTNWPVQTTSRNLTG